MKFGLLFCSVVFGFCLLLILDATPIFAQTDSSQTNLSFDFGITRGRNINLWPVFRKYRDPEKKELQIFYPIYSKSINYVTQSAHHHFIPFFITDSSSNGIDNRVVSLYYPTLFHYQKKTTPLATLDSYKLMELAPSIAFFGISKSSGGLVVENNLFFFVWYKKDSLNNTRFVVFPAYWYFTKAHDTTQLFLPFYYKKQTPYKSQLNIALLYNQKKTQYESKYRLLPVWWSKNSFTKNDTIQKRVVFPLYWSNQQKTINNKIILPLIYSLKNPNYQSLTVLPFVSKGHSTDAARSHLFIFPNYWHQTTKQQRLDVLFPIWWNRSIYLKNDTITRKTVFPLYWSERGNTHKNNILIPFIYSYSGPNKKSFTVFPFYSFGYNTKLNSWYVGITPIYWHKQQKSNTTDLVLPLYWRTKECFKEDTLIKNTIFPLYWSARSNNLKKDVVVPLIYRYEDSKKQSFTLFPLFSFGHHAQLNRSYVAITPLFWHKQQNLDTKDIFFPIYWHSKTCFDGDTLRKTTLFPIYWSYKSANTNNQIVFPLVFSLKNPKYQSLTVLPLFSKGGSTDATKHHFDIFPFYWRLKTEEQLTKVIFPVWWSMSKYSLTDTVILKTLFPIYWSAESNEKRSDIVFPFMYRFQNQSRKSFTLFPIYSFGQNTYKQSSYVAVTPLFWHKRQPNEVQNIFFPIYWRGKRSFKDDTITKTTIFPIYWSYKSSSIQNRILFPVVFSFKNPNYQSFTLLPIFSKGHATEGFKNHLAITPFYWNLKDDHQQSHVLFPIWWANTSYFGNDTLSRKTLFPIYWSVRGATKSNDVLFPLVYRFKNENKKSFTFFPLFSFGSRTDNDSRYVAITPLFWHTQKPSKTRNVLFPLYWHSKKLTATDTLKRNVLFPIFWSFKNNQTDHKILFPLVFSSNSKSYQSFTLFPLFSKGHSKMNENRYTLITPLAGSIRSEGESHRYLFPVFNYKKLLGETHSSAFLFVFRNIKKPDYSKTSLLWPICVREKSKNYSYFRVAPLVWYTKTDTSRLFSIQPLHYFFKSTTRNTFIFGWFLYKYENVYGQSVSHDVLWKLYNRERYTNGDFETRFFYLWYANVQKQGKREKSLLPFYYYVNSPNGNKHLSVFFSFYNHFKQFKPEINDFYEEERIFWLIRLRSNYDKLVEQGKGDFLRRK